MKQFTVKLEAAERQRLEELSRAGTAAARTVVHARILLKADQSEAGPAWTDARISEALEVSGATVERVRKRYLLGGLDAAVGRKRPPPRPRKLDGHAEAHLIALACSAPPAGHKHWTLRLLAGKVVELEEVDAVSHETVRQILKKTCSSRG
jgi:hypothetical protein